MKKTMTKTARLRSLALSVTCFICGAIVLHVNGHHGLVPPGLFAAGSIFLLESITGKTYEEMNAWFTDLTHTKPGA